MYGNQESSVKFLVRHVSSHLLIGCFGPVVMARAGVIDRAVTKEHGKA